MSERPSATHTVVIAGEGRVVRLSFMPGTVRPRHRLSETAREAGRLAQAAALTLGGVVRDARRRQRLTQRAVAAEVGVHQARISQLERGLGHGAPLELWMAIGVAIGRPLAVGFSRPLDEGREAVDAGHLAMQERLLRLARSTGRSAMFELPTRPSNPRHSIDVCVRDDRNRVLIIQEAWNTFGDIGAAVRSTNRKLAEAAELAATIGRDLPYRVTAAWIDRPTAANRALLARYPAIFRSAFPGSSRSWLAALDRGAAPPAEMGLVWLDATTGRLRAWRRTAFDGAGPPRGPRESGSER